MAEPVCGVAAWTATQTNVFLLVVTAWLLCAYVCVRVCACGCKLKGNKVHNRGSAHGQKLRFSRTERAQAGKTWRMPLSCAMRAARP